jgi:hypothetical protein
MYPLAHDETQPALAVYPQIKSQADVYSAIVAHEHLPAGDLTDEQKVVLYRAYKKLKFLVLAPAQDGYAFDYTSATSYTHVVGTIQTDGSIKVASSTPGERPNCPICLAASTLIATPSGPVRVTELRAGMLVWTQSAKGQRIAVSVIDVGSTPVPPTHEMVHLRLADGRELWASPGHRTADGRQLGTLAPGDMLDGSRIVFWALEAYSAGRTYDLLPAGDTGTYWANGILLSSTLTQ